VIVTRAATCLGDVWKGRVFLLPSLPTRFV
jgi:hypothetical protein